MLRRLLVVFAILLGLLSGGFALLVYLIDIPALIETYKPMALTAASNALNREVEVTDVRPSWFPVLGVRVEGLRIADEPLHERDEPSSGATDFVRLGAAEIGVAVWPALVSLGRNVQVSQVRLESPEIRVVRFADGSFNFDSIATSTATEPTPSEPEPADDEGEGGSVLDRLQEARIGAIAITHGTVVFEDRTDGGVGKVTLRDVDFLAENIGLGQPIQATLAAALDDAPEPNVRVALYTQPLPTRISPFVPPELERIEVNAVNIPLSMIPVEVEAADLSRATVSSEVVVSASGPTHISISGPIRVDQLALRSPGQPLGAYFTTELQLGMKLPMTFSSVEFQDTRLTVGPVGLQFEGSVELSPAPKWREIGMTTPKPFSVAALATLVPGNMPTIPDGQIALEATATGDMSANRAEVTTKWQGITYQQDGMSARGSVLMKAKVSGETQQPEFVFSVDLNPLEVRGEGFAKPAGVETQLEGAGKVTGRAVRLSEAEFRLAGARVNAEATYPLTEGDVDVQVTLNECKLVPFLTSLELPAEMLSEDAAVRTKLRYQAQANRLNEAQIAIPEWVFTSGKSRLQADVLVSRLEPLQARISAQSSYLDADQLMPEAEETSVPAEPSPPSEGPILPPSMQSAVVTVAVQIKKLLYQGAEMSDVDVDLLLKNRVLTVQKSTVGVFGGTVSGSGTTVNLGAEPLEYSMKAKVAKVKGEDMLNLFVGTGSALSGELNSDVSISGKGIDVAHVAKHLTGQLAMGLNRGRLDGVNLLSETFGPLAQAAKLGSALNLKDVGPKAATEFQKLRGSIDVADGRAELRSPLVVTTRSGDITFTGDMGLDGKLGLRGTYGLTPSAVAKLTRGKVRLKKDLPLTFNLGCELTSPCVKGVDVAAAAATVAKAVAGRALKKVAAPVTDKLGIDADKLKADKLKKEAEQKAKEVERKAQAAAEAARKKAEAEARKKAEAAKKKAEDEAKKALKGLFNR